MLSVEQLTFLANQDASDLSVLRLFLRDLTSRLCKSFRLFKHLPAEEDCPLYREIVIQPLCLADMMDKINAHKYLCVEHYLSDIDLLASNAREFYDVTQSKGRLSVNKACQLQDFALSLCCQLDKKIAARYVCVYGCPTVCMSVCVHVCMHVCLFVCLFLSVCVCVDKKVCLCLLICIEVT